MRNVILATMIFSFSVGVKAEEESGRLIKDIECTLSVHKYQSNLSTLKEVLFGSDKTAEYKSDWEYADFSGSLVSASSDLEDLEKLENDTPLMLSIVGNVGNVKAMASRNGGNKFIIEDDHISTQIETDNFPVKLELSTKKHLSWLTCKLKRQSPE